MSHIIKHTAQWINKPKFHILFHLPESISRAGTANLFSTEKFESFNGVLRNSSTHSNKQAPGKDIAINFSNYQSLRFLLSGGVSYNKITGSTSQCSLELRNFFTNNPVIQKSLGFNSELSNPATQYPFQKRSTLKKEDEEPVPASLLGQFPGGNICQIAQLQLNAHENIFKSSFILIRAGSEECIGLVRSLWIADGSFFVHVNRMDRSIIHPFYGMRVFAKTNRTCAVHSMDIKTTLNLQHDCHTAGCPVTSTRSTRIERLDTTIKTPEVQHKGDTSFILNSASLHSPETHRRLADLPIPDILPSEWIKVCHAGLERWGAVNEPAAECQTPPETPPASPDESPAETPRRSNTPFRL
ncbi:hypothetical protein PCANC_07490 [Puccinia coronata f. sp. avenae]|nr:hypothetical protein PCANC_07490 [Puccinia coronata f. sp. avenae]